MTEQTHQLATLSPEAKRALLADLLRRQLGEQGATPLTYGQQAMWFLHHQAPESSAYNVSFAARVGSAVDGDALRRALGAVIARHAPLRTVYATREGKPVQIAQQRAEVALTTVDATGWDDDALDRAVRAAHAAPFDLEQGPVVRCAIFSRAERDHLLLLTAHHIAFDAWSLWVLLGELRTLYQAERAGTTAALPPLAAHYGDYARWQADLLAGPEGERLWRYWQGRLADAPAALDLPTDRPRPPVQTYAGATIDFVLDADLTGRVRALARAEQATVYTVLLAAYQALLHRYSGQETIVVGSPVAGRSRPEFAGLIGDFINMIALRADFAADDSFRTFLAQARRTVLDALDHQDFPFVLLVNRLGRQPDPRRSPVFQAAFNLRNIQMTSDLAALGIPGRHNVQVDLGGLLLAPYPLHQQEGQLDLTLQMTDTGEQLFGNLQYNTDLFDAATIARMVAHYRTLLGALVAEPDAPIATLPLLDADERREVLTAWNATDEPYPQHLTLPELLASQAERTPGAVAVSGEGEQLTYAALDAAANRLARQLRQLGIGAGDLVGVCLERTPRLPVALLGVLKAGAAYLPLDPGYPAARLSFILDDAAAVALLTDADARPTAVPPDLRVLCLDELAAPLGRASAEPVSAVATPDDLAYVIYTSGSTGQPKGVELPHRAVVNFLSTMARRPGLGPGDVLVAVTTVAFDIAVLELFLPLVVGATVVLADRDTARDGQALGALLRERGATVIQATPATFRLLLTGDREAVRRVRCLCGGEALPPDLARDLLDAGAELWNMYGPTETTVWSTVARVERAEATIPVGRPIGNTRTYILDGAMQPVPPGVVGELWIGGAGVARGYRHRPDLTAERFVADPFVADPMARLYRTGDRARYRRDGAIEVLGRTDQQVKLRGFRIELAEVEAALRAHAAVAEAVALVREDRPGDRRLVAYLTATAGPPPNPGELRRALRRQLPDYMVPSAFIVLPALPRTLNGKIDRRALPAPADDRAPTAPAPSPPVTSTERALAAIWSKILGVAQVGTLESFFDLGGHSLQAMEVLAAIEAQLGVRPAPALLRIQTLGQLAASCDDLLAQGGRRELPPTPAPSLGGRMLGALRRIASAEPTGGGR